MLGVGILGAGYFGAFHARAIATIPELRIAAVCAEGLALAEAFAAEHGGSRSHERARASGLYGGLPSIIENYRP